MAWRLGIDLGTNSLGWAAFDLQRLGDGWMLSGLKDAGVRIFSDGRNPKDKQSNAAKRREPKGARKNRDRYLRRRARLMRQLIEFGLMPTDKASRKALEGGKGRALIDTDPWILRARALNEALTPYQFGRAIFHLHQRRGFKSNRKTDRGNSESGKVYEAIKKTKATLSMQGARTLGELFGQPRYDVALANQSAQKGARQAQPGARVRKFGEGAKWGYEYYPTRELILDELDMMWEAQKPYHPNILTDIVHKALYDTIEWQHPLKSPPVGKCTLMPEHERAPKALPSAQLSRILQEVNALRVGPAGELQRILTDEERQALTARLCHPTNKTGELSFTQIRKLLGLSVYDYFNTESEKRSKLQGDMTACKLMQTDRWGPSWLDLDLTTQDEIIDRLINEEKEDVLISYLVDTQGLKTEQAYRVADCPLPEGYGRLSQPALKRLQPHLERGLIYSDAATKEFGDHRPLGTGEVHDKALPYYGYVLERSVAFGTGDVSHSDEKRYGKIANPTVHVALNQIRAVVNDLMKRYGAPEQIVIELARDLPLSAKGKSELDRRQKNNQNANEARAKELEKLGIPNNYQNRMRMRLYEDLDALGKRCVFTGEPIALTDLFTDKVEVEHILPFSRTFDDGYANKTLCLRRANRDKGNKTPFEAFGDSPQGYDWDEISKRAAELPPNKKWRFGPDAMERYEKDGGFLARQLTDTQYIARLAKAYLEAIYGGQGQAGSDNHVWVIPGRLTADLRWQWGLDSVLRGHNEEASDAHKKNRQDHRHHAIDAIVVGCTDRGMLKRAADRAKANEEKFDERLMSGIKEPWPNFRHDVQKVIETITISYKPDHGIQAAMHNDTAYGIPKGKEGKPDKKGVRTVVTRKPLDSDSFKAPKDLEKIRDHYTKMRLLEATQGLTGKDFKMALLAEAATFKPPVNKVRIEENLRVIPFQDHAGETYKAYKGDGNYCYDIWVDEKGKWIGEVISTYDAYQRARIDPKWWQNLRGRDGQALIMRLRKNDMLQITDDQKRSKIVQIYKFSTGVISMSEHFEANASARIRDKTLNAIRMSPSSLQKAKAKRVTVSPSGVVKIYT